LDGFVALERPVFTERYVPCHLPQLSFALAGHNYKRYIKGYITEAIKLVIGVIGTLSFLFMMRTKEK